MFELYKESCGCEILKEDGKKDKKFLCSEHYMDWIKKQDTQFSKGINNLLVFQKQGRIIKALNNGINPNELEEFMNDLFKVFWFSGQMQSVRLRLAKLEEQYDKKR